MISLIFIALAAIANAMMDILQSEYTHSVFTKTPWFKRNWLGKYIDNNPRNGLKKLFWKIPLPAAFWNGWYMAKTVMIISIVLAAAFGPLTLWMLLIAPILWTVVFEAFYGYFWRRSGERASYFKRIWDI